MKIPIVRSSAKFVPPRRDSHRKFATFAHPVARSCATLVLLVMVGAFLSGCTHRNQKAWSDQRESGNAPLSQPSVTPEPTANPTPTLQEFIEQKMAELDEIDEELSVIDQMLRSSPPTLDETD